jgi:hypothetical protein
MSMLTPGPIELEMATFRIYTPFDVAGFERTI